MENICEWENCKESGKFKAPQKKIIAKIINGYVKNTLNYLIKIGIILMECHKMKLKIF